MLTDRTVFSIEDAKQKAEYDKMLQLAEQKKTSVREEIQSLRDQFQKLVARNNTLPPHLMLNRKVSRIIIPDNLWTWLPRQSFFHSFKLIRDAFNDIFEILEGIPRLRTLSGL